MALQTAEMAAGLCVEHVDGARQVSGGEELPVAAVGDGGGGVGESRDRGFMLEGFTGEERDVGRMRGGEIVRFDRRKCD